MNGGAVTGGRWLTAADLEPFAHVCPVCKGHVSKEPFRCGGPHERPNRKRLHYDFYDSVPVVTLEAALALLRPAGDDRQAALADVAVCAVELRRAHNDKSYARWERRHDENEAWRALDAALARMAASEAKP